MNAHFMNLFHFFFILEKDEVNDIRGASKAQSKSGVSQSSAASKSDHLVKLNLDIGSMVEVGSKTLYTAMS